MIKLIFNTVQKTMGRDWCKFKLVKIYAPGPLYLAARTKVTTEIFTQEIDPLDPLKISNCDLDYLIRNCVQNKVSIRIKERIFLNVTHQSTNYRKHPYRIEIKFASKSDAVLLKMLYPEIFIKSQTTIH